MTALRSCDTALVCIHILQQLLTGHVVVCVQNVWKVGPEDLGNGRLFWCCCYHCRCSWASEITTSSICRCTCKFSAQTTSGSTVPSCIYIRVVAQTNVVWLPNVTERSVAMSWISLFHNPVTEICVDLAPRWRNACCTCRRSRTFLLRWGKWVQTVHFRAQDSSVSKI